MFYRKLLLLSFLVVFLTDMDLSVSLTPNPPWAAPWDYYLPSPPLSDTITGVSIRNIRVDSTLSLDWEVIYQVRRAIIRQDSTWDYQPAFYFDGGGNKLTMGAVGLFVPLIDEVAK